MTPEPAVGDRDVPAAPSWAIAGPAPARPGSPAAPHPGPPFPPPPQSPPVGTPAEPQPAKPRSPVLPVSVQRSPDTGRGLSPLDTVLLTIVPLGFATVVLSYTLAREHSPIASVVYWLGQVVAYLVALVWLVSTHRRHGQRAAMVALVAAGQSVLTYAYSPVVFKFPDALQHWRTADDLLTTGHLFTPSPTLPVSPEFPGLEVATVAVVQTLHLPLFYAGLIVVSLCHILLAVCAFSLYDMITRSGLVAGVAAMLFSTTPHAFMFNALFVYGAFALPFFVLAVRAALGHARKGFGWPQVGVSVACLGVCIVSHPLTALAGMAFLVLLSFAMLVARAPRAVALQCLASAMIAGGLAAAWVLLVAKDVTIYLGAPVISVASSLLEFGKASGQTLAASAPELGTAERIVSFGSVAVAAILLMLGQVFVRSRRTPVVYALSLTALLYFGILAVRVLDPRGAEIATRALTYVALFSSIPLAMAMLDVSGLRESTGDRFRLAGRARGHDSALVIRVGSDSPGRRAVAVGLGMILIGGGMVSGWPAAWERLPGTVYVGGFESGVDGGNLELAQWAATSIKRDQRMSCELTTCSLVGAFSHQFPIGNGGEIFYATSLTPAIAREAAILNMDYVVVNQLMAQQVPITGGYFGVDPMGGQHFKPIDQAQLDKFAKDPRLLRVYDDGQYQVYDIRVIWNG